MKRSRKAVAALRLRCAGLDCEGCPEDAVIGVALGGPLSVGLTLPSLRDALAKAAWGLATGEGRHGVPVVDPLCPTCGAKLKARILEEAQGKGEPGALERLARTFTPDDGGET